MHIYGKVYITSGTESSVQEEILWSCLTLCTWFMLCIEAGNMWKRKTCVYIIETQIKISSHKYIHIPRACNSNRLP